MLTFRRNPVKLELFHVVWQKSHPLSVRGRDRGAVKINYLRRATIKDE